MASDELLSRIEISDTILMDHFAGVMKVDCNLSRKIVSFQANKTRSHYRWYKYKEAFSVNLVDYLFSKFPVNKGIVLDPFAGAGTSLFACSSLGFDSHGIEVLPVGQKIIEANIYARGNFRDEILSTFRRWIMNKPWNDKGPKSEFEILRITKGAYPESTQQHIQRYLYELRKEAEETKELLLFSLLCVLESVSYTRKDGQYLRWDHRSNRGTGKNTFNKGVILSFNEAILNKLREVRDDISQMSNQYGLFPVEPEGKPGRVHLHKGSCLEILPKLKDQFYSAIITSPPYCNRYDYTRTYALEHALLGVTEQELRSLRQSMLSCTVENKEKELCSINSNWQKAIDHCDKNCLLQDILSYLDFKKDNNELNNNGIARMVRGYFYEMSCVIQECNRVLNEGGIMLTVNDNVKYAGASISVDIILSSIAEAHGFCVEDILVLPQKKGNSSQQMGKHGRESLRKCVYVWRKKS